MSIPIYQVDAFADQPFSGNPACVCLMSESKSDEWMQSVAIEMNLSETAFVWRRDDHFHLRWFTPAAEVELCGHATLATSHALWQFGWLDNGTTAVFDTLSGKLEATQVGEGIVMDFPSKMPTPAIAPDGLLEGLGIDARFIGTDGTDYMIEVESEDVVRNLRPNFQMLQQVTARGIIVTSKSEQSELDFISRFFAPACGINEDPVTGSAHCLMAPYWSEKLKKNELSAFQASQRGGRLGIRVHNDRVFLSGRAQTVFHGQLMA